MTISESGSHLFSTAASTGNYYKSLNKTYRHLFGKHLMLHYPFYKSENESLEIRQLNLTNYCLSHAAIQNESTLLEVGCGNGIQTLYIAAMYNSSRVIGIDLNEDNILLALQNKDGQENIEFRVDDAQKLDTIKDNSIDLLLCIESAFHYPDKHQFLQQITRVLKPGGKFIIADIINKSHQRKYVTSRWKRKMSFYHWTLENYMESTSKAGLTIEHNKNITESVINGYQGSSNWISRNNCSSLVTYLMFKIFVIIQVGINVRLLKNKESYYLFTGYKPA